MALLRIDTYEQLETYLRTCVSVGGGDDYDFVGLVHLLAACLDNLQAHALEAELEDIGGCFTDSQKAYLKKLVDFL